MPSLLWSLSNILQHLSLKNKKTKKTHTHTNKRNLDLLLYFLVKKRSFLPLMLMTNITVTMLKFCFYPNLESYFSFSDRLSRYLYHQHHWEKKI